MITNVQFFNKNTNAWEAMNAVYPITFEKKLDREFDSGEFITVGDARHEPYTPMRIVIGDTQATADTFYFYGNTAQKWSPSGVMQNSVRLVEPTKILQGRFVDGLAVDQPLQGTQKTLKDVIERVFRVTPLRTSREPQEFILTTDSEIVSILQNTISPEYKWSSQTSLWEVLCDIGAYIDAMPRLMWNTSANKFNIVTFDLINQQKAKIENLAYYGKLTNFDESQYCTILESIVDNMAVKDEMESTLIFPNYYGFVTPRTNDLRLTDQNCEIILDKRISQLSRLWMNSKNISVRYHWKAEAGIQRDFYVSLNLATGEYIAGNGVNSVPLNEDPRQSVDLTPYVKEYEEWKTLDFFPNNQTGATKSKNNTIYWKRYGNTVTILNTSFGIGITGIFTKSVFKYLLETWAYDTLKDSVRQSIYATPSVTSSPREFVFEKVFIGNQEVFDVNADPRNFEFQVWYIPFDDGGKMRVPKANNVFSADFIQPFNQRAEINDSVAYGQNMQGTVNRMGVDCITAPAQYKIWSEIHKIGDVYVENGQEYIITNIMYSLTCADLVSVVYSLSKDWNYLSQYFNIDKKFRSWNIPSESIKRELYYTDYCVVSDTVPVDSGNFAALTVAGKSAIASGLKSDVQVLEPINTCWLNDNARGTAQKYSIMSASAFSFGNSIKIAAKAKNNLSVGVNIATAEGNNKYCQDVLYCQENGTLNTGRIYFARELQDYDADMFPRGFKGGGSSYGNVPKDELIDIANLVIDKAPSECLAINYQLFFVSEKPTTIITNKFVAENNLVKFGIGGNQLTVWGIKTPLPKMSQIINSNYADQLTQTVTVEEPTAERYFTVSVGNINSQYLGWAISQGQNLFIAQYRDINGNLPTTLYFNFKHSIK